MNPLFAWRAGARRALRRQRSVRLRLAHRRTDDPLDRLSAELVHVDGVWVRIYRKAYAEDGGGDRFPGLPRDERGAGAPSGRPTFVLLHGIGVSARYFSRLAEDLSQLGDVFLLDLPGFAGLPHPEHVLSIAGFAAVVHRVLRAHGVHHPIYVGHSMGTQVVTELLARASGTARTAVLIGPVVDDAKRTTAQQAIRFLRSALHETGALKLIAVRAYAQTGPGWILDVLPQMMRYRIEERLPEVGVPVALVRGEFDRVAPDAWLERLPAKSRHVVAGAAHSVMYAHDRAVFHIVADIAR